MRASAETARRSKSRFEPFALLLQALILFVLCTAHAEAGVDIPKPNPAEPIAATAQAGNQWQLGAYEVWILRGDCVIQQGQTLARAREAVLWIQRADPTQREQQKVIAYLEGNVEITFDRASGAIALRDKAWLGRFFTSASIDVRAAAVAGKPDVLPPVYWRGMELREPETAENGWRPQVEQTQYLAPAPNAGLVPVARPQAPSTFPATRPGSTAPVMTPVPGMAGPVTMESEGRRIQVFPRSDVPFQPQWFPDPSGNQWIAVIDSGVNVIVDGLKDVGTIDISTDRLVIWTAGREQPDLANRTYQDERVPLEFYMEGNIIFRQGERVITADRMYYDVPNNVGTILNADVLTPVRSYSGLLRLHADVLHQTAKDRFYAQNTFVTSSRMGEPGYRLQAGDIYFEDIQKPLVDASTGLPLVDPGSGQPAVEHERLATSSNNVIFVGSLPVFYWPILATDLNDPTFYIRRAQLRQDNVFGVQALTNWSGYELLGIKNKPEGTDLDISLDYLSKRGFGHGGSFTYDREGVFALPGHVMGLADYWGIKDNGLDDLGQGRMNIPPEKDYRYRLFWQHRHLLPYDLQLSAELGWISDRNFLEEYYKNEWDSLKDETTGLELKHFGDNSSWSITADYRINNFFTQTDWLPRGDHFWIGQSLFNDTFTWYEHSNAAYGRLRRASVPDNVAIDGPFNFLPWEFTSPEGERLATRQEIDWPFQLGAVKVVPYLLGELAHWGQDIDGSQLNRAWGQAGVRASLPMWSVDPTVSDDLLNIHGIAHKVVFDIEFAYADSNKNLEDLPLYDPLDDDSVEAFRRRYLTSTYGIPSLSPMPLPLGSPWIPRFDERLYALRSGLQSWVTSPSTEVADDLTFVRLGASQRWQTKRGPAHNRHIIDWVTLDTNITLFPDPSRDDFGQTAGLLDYDFRWHVGDRVTLVSDAVFDFFNQGQKIISVGGFLTRPPRGSLYMGLRLLEGPIDHKILSFSYSYWMSPKWVSTFGTSIGLDREGNIGQNFSITRVGESFLISAGFTVDAARNDVGVALAIEPRFLPKSRLGSVGGAQIPPAGSLGLE